MTTNQQAREVVQADREAAADYISIWAGPSTDVAYVRDGRSDNSPLVQAFAAHRLAALSTTSAPYLSDRFEWAAPGDQQEDAWIVRFCDNDVRDALYTGPDAEQEARAAWERHAAGYNMFLFRLARLSPALSTTSEGASEWSMVKRLRDEEADSVLILCDNPDGPPNSAVECCGFWTGFRDRRFEGRTMNEALVNAVAAKDAAQVKGYPPIDNATSEGGAVEALREAYGLLPQGAPIKLMECPPGPFLFQGTVGVKTEYGAMRPTYVGRTDQHVTSWPDAYCLETGEAFWGGTSRLEDRAELFVLPLALASARGAEA